MILIFVYFLSVATGHTQNAAKGTKDEGNMSDEKEEVDSMVTTIEDTDAKGGKKRRINENDEEENGNKNDKEENGNENVEKENGNENDEKKESGAHANNDDLVPIFKSTSAFQIPEKGMYMYHI